MSKQSGYFTVQDVSISAFNWRNVGRIDWLMPLLALALAVVGWFTIYSASRTGDPSLFQKQILFFAIGGGIALVLACTDYRFIVSMAPVIYVVVVSLLVCVLLFGEVVNGARRWIDLGPFNLQPSELSKLALIFMLTWYLGKVGKRIKRLPYFLGTFVLALVPMLLILKQPNLGTAVTLGPIAVVMLFVAGCRVRHMAALTLVGFMVVPFVWFQMHDFNPNTEEFEAAKPGAERNAVRDRMKKEYKADRKAYEFQWHQKMRIYSFLHPEADKDASWQTVQSKITVGSGGLRGKGYLNSTQTILKYLPEHHTDFIFSLLAEEQGFIGAALVIGLFAAFFLRGLAFARECPDMAGVLLATGVVTVLAFHVFVNIGITIGLLPVTGLPLPFLSYGGSFYLTTMSCVGILLNVPMRRLMFSD
jgi:rod shape determining protein RodA